MSDNRGTYVLQTYGPEFRVAVVPAIENIFAGDKKLISEAFDKSKVYTSIEDAWDDAELLDEKEMTEYGANLITEFSEVQFSSLREQDAERIKKE